MFDISKLKFSQSLNSARQLLIHVFFDYYKNGEMLQATTALTENDFGRMDTLND